jgi:hypothetical protein
VAGILVYLFCLSSASTGEVKEEWDVENVNMVETYMCIPDACLP